MNFSSKLLENAVNEVSQLPGIGKRTALRLVLHLLKQPKSQTHQLANVHIITASVCCIEQSDLTTAKNLCDFESVHVSNGVRLQHHCLAF